MNQQPFRAVRDDAVANTLIPVVPDTGTDIEQLVEELVANAARRTEAPLELTIDARDDVVRVEVHDQTPRVALGLEEHPRGHRGALGPAATDSLDRWGAAPPGERDQVLWAELRSGDDRG